nr:MmgE/PrpD family protein [Mesobacillus subterraneus]
MIKVEPAIIQTLVEFCCQYYDEEFPAEVIKEAKVSLVDYFSALVWGTTSEYYANLLQYAKSVPVGNSSIIGVDFKTSATEAAFINSVVSHSMEIDDIHLGTAGLHPGVTIIPSVIAIAEELGTSGKDILKAIVVGYEVAGRIGKALSPSHRYRGFHATGTIGVFGSAAAAAFLKKLTPEKFTHALSLAASQAGGTFAFLTGGVGVKYLHAGNSSKNGIQSTIFAELGFTGPTNFLEHPEGFAQAYASEFNLKLILEGLGESFEILDIFRKRYFICGHIFPSIEALPANIYLQEPDKIEKIEVYTYKAASVLKNKRPANFAEAKFSIPYCISSLSHFKGIEDCFKDKEILESIYRFSDKIHVYEKDEYTFGFPEKRRTCVNVFLKNKDVLHGHVELPKGTPDNPYSIDEIAGKLKSALESIGKKEIAKSLLGCIETMDRQGILVSLMIKLNKI